MGYLLLVGGAFAYTWDYGYAPSGDSLEWHLCPDDFTASHGAVIEEAAEAWTAGPGSAMRGALWSFVQGGDRSDCQLNNGINEVYARSQSWFTQKGHGGALAVCFCNDDDGVDDSDIVFNYSAFTWSSNGPSAVTDASARSIGMVALHEFGHAIGFLHEFTTIAAMNNYYPNGGDLGGWVVPSEDEYVGLVDQHPDSSTGRNFMLSRFVRTTPGASAETWYLLASARWYVCDGEVDGASAGPDAIGAIIEGTATLPVDVDWWLSTDTLCDAGTSYWIATATPVLSSNTPFYFTPDTYDFSGVPAGTYYVCAKINPDGALSEATSRDDNEIRSEIVLTVEDC